MITVDDNTSFEELNYTTIYIRLRDLGITRFSSGVSAVVSTIKNHIDECRKILSSH
jgi:hypothetical protein